VIAIIAFQLCLGLISAINAQSNTPQAGKDTIRPFKVKVPEKDLVDLRRRIAATRWPDKETVADQSQGVQLARLQELVRYWGTDYDWRKVRGEAQRSATIHDKHRWGRHSLHPRPLKEP